MSQPIKDFVDGFWESSSSSGSDDESSSDDKVEKIVKNKDTKIQEENDSKNHDVNKFKKAGQIVGEALDIAGEIALDVVTGGIYGLTTGTVDAVDGLQAAEEKAKKKDQQVSMGDKIDIVADAFTGGLYSAIDFSKDDSKDDDQTKKSEPPKKEWPRSHSDQSWKYIVFFDFSADAGLLPPVVLLAQVSIVTRNVAL